MKNKLLIILFSFFAIFSLCAFVPKIEAKTLGELKQELLDAKSNKAAQEARRRNIQAKINKYDNQIEEAGENIEKAEDEIEQASAEIEELEIEIEEKYKEIDELMVFLQVSEGENIYLEYVFGATSFTDFIYRSSIVEQLSKHNDELIVEMNDLIEQNKALKIKLAEQIKKEEQAIKELEKLMASLDLTIDDIEEHQKDLAAEIKAQEEEIKYYEQIGCEDDEDITVCISVPYAVGFTRPLVKGKVSSNYGYRTLWGKRSFHSGIDIAVSEKTKVYASAAGYVSRKVSKSKCGGNIVYVQHNIGGSKYTTVYMHLYSFNVNVGDLVTLNSVVGLSGGGSSTKSYDKCTTGAHLHFGIYKGWGSEMTSVNPRNYVNFPSKGSSFYSRW